MIETDDVTPSRDIFKLAPPRRETPANEIARRLIEHFFAAGRLSPGDRLPSERALADALGVGRGVVREALKSLSLLGLVDVRVGDGTYLTRPDNELLPRVIEWGLLLGERRIRDLVEARSLLERDVARLAAQRRSEEDLAELRVLLDRMREATVAVDFVDADLAFHLRLAQASGNTVLADMLSSVQSLIRVWINRVMHNSPDWGPSLREHESVLAALESADPDATEAAMSGHMAAALGRLRQTLDERDDRDLDARDLPPEPDPAQGPLSHPASG
jgi:GntR family transcriptional repressor for pyruvate dehydrogenase complex